MMICLVVLLLASATCDPLEDSLKSGGGVVKVFSAYTATQRRTYSPAEAPQRLRMFRSELQAVVATNKADLGWTAGLNQFSDMSEAEKAQYLGINATLIPAEAGQPMLRGRAKRRTPSSIDWRYSGAVTGVKDQVTCYCSWAFAAVASIEGVHKIFTAGPLIAFSEQEILDCTYEGLRDGCQGGWYYDAFSLVKRTGRLASGRDAQYRGRDGSCNYSRKQNSLLVRVTGYNSVSKSENGLVSALQGGPVAVAFQATSQFSRYRGGLFRDTYCTSRPTHAATVVGYSSDAIIVKNSWGTKWGEGGYIRFARGGSNCGLYDYGAIVTMSRRLQEQE